MELVQAEFEGLQTLREQFDNEKRFVNPLKTLETLILATNQTTEPPKVTLAGLAEGNYNSARVLAAKQGKLEDFEREISWKLRELLIKELALETIHASSPNPPMHARKRAAQRLPNAVSIGEYTLSHALQVVNRVAELLGPLRLKFRPFADGSMADKLETMIVAKGSAAAANGGCPPTMKLCDFKTLQEAGACPWPDTNVWSFVPGGFCISSKQSVPIRNGQDLRDRVDRLQSQATDLLILFPEFKDAFNTALVDQDTITRLSTLSFEEADIALVSRTINYMYTEGNTYIKNARKDLKDACLRVMRSAIKSAKSKDGILPSELYKWVVDTVDNTQSKPGNEGNQERLRAVFLPFWRLSYEAFTCDPAAVRGGPGEIPFTGGLFGGFKAPNKAGDVDIPDAHAAFDEKTDTNARVDVTGGVTVHELAKDIVKRVAQEAKKFDAAAALAASARVVEGVIQDMVKESAIAVRTARARYENAATLCDPPSTAVAAAEKARIDIVTKEMKGASGVQSQLKRALMLRRQAAAFVLYAQLVSNEVNAPLNAYTDDLETSMADSDGPKLPDGTVGTAKWRDAYKVLTSGLNMLDTSPKAGYDVTPKPDPLATEAAERARLSSDNEDALVLASYVLYPRTPDVLMMMCELAIACNASFDFMFKAFKFASVKDPRDATTLMDLATSSDPSKDGVLRNQLAAAKMNETRKAAQLGGKDPLLDLDGVDDLDGDIWSSRRRQWGF